MKLTSIIKDKIKSLREILKERSNNGLLNTISLLFDGCFFTVFRKNINLSRFVKKKVYKHKPWKKKRKLRFQIHLTTHCNLNCKCCDTYSCIADEEFCSTSSVEKDLKRLAELTDCGLRTENICLSGGEPLLHPNLKEIILMIGKHLPRASSLEMMTNGLLLMQQDDDFWKTLFENKYNIALTKYPINLPFEDIYKRIESKGVGLSFRYNTDKAVKTMWIKQLNLEGTENYVTSFNRCGRANKCITLKDGKLYTCTLIPRVHIFNKFFNKNLEVLPEDSIDIYKVKELSEILKFLSRPVPFCRYCSIDKNVHGIKWDKTEKKLSEFVRIDGVG